MQSTIITLPVDITDTDTLVDCIYNRQEEYLHRTLYIAATHAVDMRNTLMLYRTPPKPTSAFKGVQKQAFKFTRDISILNPVGESIVSPMIGEVSFSIPVGATAAQRLEIAQTIGAMALHRAVMAGLMDQQSI